MERSDRTRIIANASWAGIIGNGILAAMKIIAGLISGSLAVVGDGIDSSTDILTSVITLITARVSSKPPDKHHPYGHERAETVAAKVLSFVIFFAGGQLCVSSIQTITSGVSREIPSILALYATSISIVGKIGLALYKFQAGKKTKSSMLIADAKNMRNDVLISSTVFTGLLFTIVLKAPILDPIIALCVGIWILKTAWGIFWESSRELMDGMSDLQMYQKLFSIIKPIHGAVHPHKVRIRKFGFKYVVDLDLEVDGSLTVRQAHEISKKVEQALIQQMEYVSEVMVHIEPVGNVEEEPYGISSKDYPASHDSTKENGNRK